METGKFRYQLANGGSTYVVKTVTWQNSAPSQVIPPEITPLSGTITIGTATVTITDDVTGSTIRYTTNGTEPTSSNGTIYKAPFVISSSTTIKAMAIKAGFVSSRISVARITVNPTVDNVAPTAPNNVVATNITNVG